MVSRGPLLRLTSSIHRCVYLVFVLTFFMFSVLMINQQQQADSETLRMSVERAAAGSYRQLDVEEGNVLRLGSYISVDTNQMTNEEQPPIVSPAGLYTTQTLTITMRINMNSAKTGSRLSRVVTPSYLEEDVKMSRDTFLRPSPGDDRILSQLLHVPASNQKLIGSDEKPLQSYKRIYVFNGLPEGVPSETRKFINDGCPVTNCLLTDDPDSAASADVILFSSLMGRPVEVKPEGQLWIMYFLESPIHTQNLTAFRDLVNWTATYRRDSTLVTPYEKFVPYLTNATIPPTVPFKNYAKGKTKKVAWFVSNCYTTNARLAYARELQRYIEVDIYGDCGKKRCSRSSAAVCFEMLRSDYKFYLSFENSNCRDYITEKFFTNALSNDVIPVVMGAHPADYRKVAPPHSFIHVDDFRSPRDLAKYLHKLDKNDTLYNEYFSWKGSGQFIDTKFWCRLCSMLHQPRHHGTWYENIQDWWAGSGICRKSPNERTWPTWKAW